jgi:tetratricopeptide (TPR) repeat protein
VIGFAGAVGQAMGRMNSPAAIAAMELLVADVLAREAQRPTEAREAIDRSIALDPSAGQTAHRLGRALAFMLDDDAWAAHAMSALFSMDLPSTDAGSLASQAARSALLVGGEALGPALEHLQKASTDTARLAALLRLVASDASTEHVLAELAEVEADEDRARALRLVAAWLDVRSDRAEQAFTAISQIADASPGDVTALTALATLHHAREDYGAAADALATAASAVDDETLTRALLLEVALLRWRAGDRDGAVTQLSTLASDGMDAVRPLLAWALRAAKADDLDARRRAVAAGASQRDPATVALEHLGIDIAQGEDPSRSLASLSEATGNDGSPMAVVADIARAVASRSAEERQDALLDLAKRGQSTAAVTAAAAHAAVLDDARGGAPAPDRILASSRAWAETAPCAEAALEWYGAARALGDLDAQAEALRTLGATLPGDVGGAIAGSGEITRFTVNGSARLLAREDAAARLADLETSPPGCSPARRAYALHHAADALGEETSSVARLIVGFNALAAGDAERAVHELRAYTRDYPDDLGAWDGLREAAMSSGAYDIVAEACGRLATNVDDPARSAELWEQAAMVLGEEVRDVARAELALERAVAADIRRFSSFDKLFRIVRARQDGPRLLELITRRLEVAENPEEIAKLFWERARVLRKSGDPAAALEALENVVMLEPDHVGALALTGEIFITEKRFKEAAKQLERLARLQDAPNQQRLMSGIAAADIYENKLGKLEEAVGVLLSLDQAQLATPAVRERLARTAAKAGRWKEGADAFTRLAHERETREGRIEAARLAMAIHRDRLENPWDAIDVVRILLTEIPDDGEALDLVISCAFDPGTTAQWLREGAKATGASLVRDPRDVEKAKRLVEIAKLQEDPTLQQVALGIQVAAGARDATVDEALAAFEARMAKTPSVALDDALLASIRHEDDRGPLADLFRALAPTLAEALGPGPTALAVGRKERMRAKDGHPLRNEVAAWAGAMGIGEFEMYHGGRDPDGIYGVPAEVPILVLGGNVKSPLAPQYRACLARELLALRIGTSIIRYRDPTDIAALVTAACNIAGVQLDSPPYAMLAEFERQLSKELPRKLRKALPDLVQPVAASGQDAIAWAHAATATLDRMASLACGDVSWALVSSAADRGSTLASPEGRDRASRLLSFVLTPRFAQLRARLGLEASA